MYLEIKNRCIAI